MTEQYGLLIAVVSLAVCIVVQSISIGRWCGRHETQMKQVKGALFEFEDGPCKFEDIKVQQAIIKNALFDASGESKLESVQDGLKAVERVLNNGLCKRMEKLEERVGGMEKTLAGCPVRRTDRGLASCDEP